MVGALILIFLHPDLPKIFGHILKISMCFSTTYSTVEHYSDFFLNMKILNFNFAKGPKKKWLGFFVCM